MNSTLSHARWMLALDFARRAVTELQKEMFCNVAAYYQGQYVTQLAEEKSWKRASS